MFGLLANGPWEGNKLLCFLCTGEVFLKGKDSGLRIGMWGSSFERVPVHSNERQESFLSPHLNNKVLDRTPKAVGASGDEANRQVTEGKFF